MTKHSAPPFARRPFAPCRPLLQPMGCGCDDGTLWPPTCKANSKTAKSSTATRPPVTRRSAPTVGPESAVSRSPFTAWRRPVDGGSVRFSRGCGSGVFNKVPPIPASSP
eukprot:4786802-Pleurochrysis_carterae.AAC.2